MNKKFYQIPSLFHLGDIETKGVLKAANIAHQALGELKGVVHIMPNPAILLGTLPLQEAKESSEIENIITTEDELYRSNFDNQDFSSLAAKEVHSYAQAIHIGFEEVAKTGLISLNLIKKIQQELEKNNAGFRTQKGTGLINQSTGERVYSPPQHIDEIDKYMRELELFINDSDELNYDPLVKMAIIHHQFESIHPFYDGNGRTGRIINILYLVQQQLLDSPVLYLSRYINLHKSKYYQLLQSVRENQDWQPWLIFMLEGIAQTAKQSVKLINQMSLLMRHHKQLIRAASPKIYSHELINNLYKHPYTKIDFVAKDCSIHRNTAASRLEELIRIGVVAKIKIGKENFYINKDLFALLTTSDNDDK